MSPKPHIALGLLAHVDAGKTTLSEALLYESGAVRALGRVDHGNAFLDTHDLERQRGITIFSKQARLSTPSLEVTLVDTPGHVDFAPEAERTMPILDCAVLVISGTDGIQAHTLTLWRLLERYQVPVFLFINKMDLPDTRKQTLLSQLKTRLSPGCTDFSGEEDLAESAAMCDEALLETYLETGTVTRENIRGLIRGRKLFPCCFGSALKIQGIREFLQVLDTYAPRPLWEEAFSAQIHKISRDPAGNRLTWLKVTGGKLQVRSPICYGGTDRKNHEEKIQQLRLYNGDKYIAVETVQAGQLCAVTGLSATYAGQGLSREDCSPVLEPVMTYRIALPSQQDAATVLPKLRLLEEEDPQLHILWDESTRQLSAQIMGSVQMEVLRKLCFSRFGLEITLEDPRIRYRETIEAPVEGIGHFEPLRHYAEVHLLLEPLPRGNGLEFASQCPTDVLDSNYQNLVLTHLQEKLHKGVLTGAPITDMRISLLIGRAHIKHTEGGDFRQATYRAVRQGLMQAKSLLLEPWYDFTLTLPMEHIGRAITDMKAMHGDFQPPENRDGLAILQGTVPASTVGDYPQQVAAYTRGSGTLQLSLRGYDICHNTQAVMDSLGYAPESDLENTPDSVFCAHGAGFTVKWDQVKDYMHLESPLKAPTPQVITRNLDEDKQLEAILRKQFGDTGTRLYRPPENQSATQKVTVRPPLQQYYIVDGYNVLFAWYDGIQDLDAARRLLLDQLVSFAAYKKCTMVVVFDGYKRKGNPGEKTREGTLQVVFTPEGVTADAYIQELAAQVGTNYHLRVVSSDSLIQLSSLGAGVLRMSARELKLLLEDTQKEMRQHLQK